MKSNRREFWWLVALQASLCFSLSCWEATAPWAEPATYPLRFVIVLISAASLATLACHVGPALFAARFGGRASPFAAALSLWLAAGYIEWLLSIVAGQRGVTSLISAAMFLVTRMCAGLVKSWWRPVSAIGLLVGTGVLVWALAANWHGLWVRNPHYAQAPLQLDWTIAQGILATAAPSVVIGWRIGRIEPNPKRILLSGFVGLWFPLVFSVTMASLAAQAGGSRYSVPSLPRDFSWALLGPHGRLEPGVLTLALWTLLCPAVICVASLKGLAPLLRNLRNLLLPFAGFTVLAFAAAAILWWEGTLYALDSASVLSNFHQLWAGSLVILGAAAALRCAVRPH